MDAAYIKVCDMLMVNALAGTGKTSTGTWGLGQRVPRGLSVSEEQKAIIRIMRGYRGSQAACAFNKSIAMELSDRAPSTCDCATSNAFGHRAWARHLDSKLNVDGLKNRKLCRELIGQSLPWKERMRVESAVDALVSLCKCYLFDPITSERDNDIGGECVDGLAALYWLCDRFDIDRDPCVLDYACRTFTKGVEPNSYIDYDDQNFLPIYHNVQLPKFGHLLVDEVQDLNRAKQEMAFRMGEQITAVGDKHQAIYGFSGADSEAMDRMWARMVEMDGEAKSLPLTITRRCPKSVVRLANTIVPALRAAEDAEEGEVNMMSEEEFHKIVGDVPSMVVCRTNAPITSLAFKLLAQGKRCYIQGRDIGSGIKAEVKRTGENILSAALAKVNDRIDRRKIEISQREFPDDAQIEALDDKLACIRILAGDADTVEEFFAHVDNLFKDYGSKDDTRLSSVHKAKGLEHPIVHIYKANKLQLRTKKAFQNEQERNLAYVAYTRSMHSLTRVYEEKEGDE